eukprot:5975085-Pleurochrysis_carterae.AAC.3
MRARRAFGRRKDVVEAEVAAPAQQDGVQAVARLVSALGHGGAAWTAVYSNMNYTGTLPAEGAIPASVLGARQQLLGLVRARIEQEVGEERLAEVREEVRVMAEAIMCVDLKLDPVVKLLGGRKPLGAASSEGWVV